MLSELVVYWASVFIVNDDNLKNSGRLEGGAVMFVRVWVQQGYGRTENDIALAGCVGGGQEEYAADGGYRRQSRGDLL